MQRLLFTLVFVSFASLGTVAHAQMWDGPTAPPQGTTVAGPVVVTQASDPEVPVRMRHVVRTRLLAAGVAVLAVGYVGAVVLGSAYLASLSLGPLSCNDQYAGWQFVPVIGPLIGMGAGASCINDNLHFEEGFFPVLSSTLQIVGLFMTIAGALGRDVPDVGDFAVSFDANGGFVSLRRAF